MPAIIITEHTDIMQRVIDEIKTCFDPEIPVDIWELGLIYELHLNNDFNLEVVMTLTSPNCPAAETLPRGRTKIKTATKYCIGKFKVNV